MASQLPEALQKFQSENPAMFQEIANHFVGVGKAEITQKFSAEKQALLKQLEDSAAKLTDGDAEKSRLETQIRELEGQVLSKEEVLKKTLERAQLEHKKANELSAKQLQESQAQASLYKQRYENHLIDNAITAACMNPETKAFYAPQVISNLKPFARVEPLKDENDKETGEYKIMLAMKDPKAGKVRDFEFSEGFKLFYEQKENANLFESKIGSGSANGARRLPASGGTAADLQNFATYVQNREAILQSS